MRTCLVHAAVLVRPLNLAFALIGFNVCSPDLAVSRPWCIIRDPVDGTRHVAVGGIVHTAELSAVIVHVLGAVHPRRDLHPSHHCDAAGGAGREGIRDLVLCKL